MSFLFPSLSLSLLKKINTNDLNTIQVISILLRNGADVNARDGFFYTPLHLACINGALACVEVLLENGADPSTKAQGSITPLMVRQNVSRGTGVRGVGVVFIFMSLLDDCAGPSI